MCRSIKPLRLPDRQVTEAEITEAALQYVRKVSGYHKPSRANQATFDEAVSEVAEATRKMLENLQMARKLAGQRNSRQHSPGEGRASSI